MLEASFEDSEQGLSAFFGPFLLLGLQQIAVWGVRPITWGKLLTAVLAGDPLANEPIDGPIYEVAQRRLAIGSPMKNQ